MDKKLIIFAAQIKMTCHISKGILFIASARFFNFLFLVSTRLQIIIITIKYTYILGFAKLSTLEMVDMWFITNVYLITSNLYERVEGETNSI